MRDLLEELLDLPLGKIMTSGCAEVGVETSMDSAAEEFLAHRVTGMPVVDEQRRCVGILSATDFIWHERSGTPDDPVRLYMSPRVHSLTADDRLVDAVRLMHDERIHRIPILDLHGRTIGIVSSLDIVSLLIGAPKLSARFRQRGIARTHSHGEIPLQSHAEGTASPLPAADAPIPLAP